MSALSPTVPPGAAKKPHAALSFHQWMIAQLDCNPEGDDGLVIQDIARDLRDDPAAGYLNNYELRKYLDSVVGSENGKLAWRTYNDAVNASLAALTTTTSQAPLIVHDLTDFKTAEFPPRNALMRLDTTDGTVILFDRSLNQVYAWRGTGKTMFVLSLGGAMATGGKFLNLQATRRTRVLYVEGVKLLTGPTEPGYFRLITLDSQPNGIPSLSTAEGRKALGDALGDAEVLILDSISTLAWIPTNDEEEWLEMLSWFARLRSRGLCVIFLHHAGKTGMQRGHSRSEDMLDVSIKLSKSPEDDEVDWLKFKLEYDKFRGERSGVRSLAVECKGGLWTWNLLEAEKLAMIENYLKDWPDASSRSLARRFPELGSYVTVSKLMRKMKTTEKKA
jgi:hypothetical protein